MAVLRIHYSIPDYERWKRAFDRDATDRKGSGVMRYAVHRAVMDPNLVMVDFELNSRQDAESLLIKMRRVWDVNGLGGDTTPEAWIGETVESAELNV